MVSFLSFVLLGCKKKPVDPKPENPMTLNFSFEETNEGWLFGYSDYPSNLLLNDSLELYKMQYGLANLPISISPPQKGLNIRGNNRSDDLFMFVKKNIVSLAPNTYYKIFFEIEIASNAATNAVGIGGAPGEAVTLKAGANMLEPKNIIDNLGDYRLNIDKGNQTVEGVDMKNLGNIGVADNTINHTLINRNSSLPITALTDANGQLWVIVGTDSGYEGFTDIYYSNIKIILEKI